MQDDLRRKICEIARSLKGVPYMYGAEWTDYKEMPSSLDCSEMTEGIYSIVGLKMPDGSQNQYNYCIHTPSPKPGDLAFFGRSARESQIYHVGILLDEHNIIEARALQPQSSFETGKVIIRPRIRWENYRNWVGFKCHPKLIEEPKFIDASNKDFITKEQFNC